MKIIQIRQLILVVGETQNHYDDVANKYKNYNQCPKHKEISIELLHKSRSST